MKVYIVGGSGFIGTNLGHSFARAGTDFMIGDLQASSEFPKHSEFLDITDYELLSKKLTGDVVVNLAAVHRDDVDDVSTYYSVNVGGAQTLCKVCEEKAINHIVFTSSVAVYGFCDKGSDEDTALNPFNHYGRSKASAEDVYTEWFERDPVNRRLTIIRPTAIFGKGNRGNIYNLFSQLNSGKFLMVGDGLNIKSIAYVENIADFIEWTIKWPEARVVVNYVDGPDLTVGDLVTHVRSCLGKAPLSRFRLTKKAGLALGQIADFLRKVGVRLPVSRVRVQKFCADSQFTSKMAVRAEFRPRVRLLDAISTTIDSEFN